MVFVFDKIEEIAEYINQIKRNDEPTQLLPVMYAFMIHDHFIISKFSFANKNERPNSHGFVSQSRVIDYPTILPAPD